MTPYKFTVLSILELTLYNTFITDIQVCACSRCVYNCLININLVRTICFFFCSFFPLTRFASPNIVRPYLVLLRSYSTNTPHTNHCIVRMLYRVAVDLKMDALLFQLSVFHLFNKIFTDPAASAYKVVYKNPPSHHILHL